MAPWTSAWVKARVALRTSARVKTRSAALLSVWTSAWVKARVEVFDALPCAAQLEVLPVAAVAAWHHGSEARPAVRMITGDPGPIYGQNPHSLRGRARRRDTQRPRTAHPDHADPDCDLTAWSSEPRSASALTPGH